MADQPSAFLPNQGWTAIAARLPSILLLLAILLGLTAYYAHRTLVVERHQALVTERAEAHARQLGREVDAAVARLNATVADTAAALPERSGGEPGDPVEANGALEAAFAAALADALPDVRRVLVLTPDDPRLEADRDFVAQVLAVQLHRGESATPEMVREGDQWQLALPLLLPDHASSRPAAAIVYLPGNLLVLPDSGADGEVRLSQHIPDGGVQHFHRAGRGINHPQVTLDLATPHWQLAFTPGEALAGRGGVWVGLVVSALLALAALACLAGAIGLKVRTALAERRAAASRQQRQEEAQLQRYHEALSLLDQYHTEDDPSAMMDGFDDLPSDDAQAAPPRAIDVLFREYDIRGNADELLDNDLVTDIGRAIGSEVLARGDRCVVLARDGRLSSPRLQEALTDGLLETGCDVLDLGLVPTPVMNFAAATAAETRSGVMITASHNPPSDNGFKIVVAGEALSGERIRDLYRRICERDLLEGQGILSHRDVREAYLAQATGDLAPTRLKVVLDGANGAAGPLAAELLARLGCEVVPLYCEPDGRFPNHPPDPTREEYLSDLKLAVKSQAAALGIALDGDGDRMVAVTAEGRVVWPDEMMMIFARDVLARHPGANIVFDVKSTHRLPALIEAYGGTPRMHRTGHSYIRAAVASEAAPLGGEYSGHLFFPDRWFGFDDGLYAAGRLIEILGLREQPLADIVATLPASVASPEILLPTDEAGKFAIIDQLQAADFFPDAEVDRTDGLRVQWPYGWGLVRASNTSAQLTLRFEADSEEHLEAIRQRFRDVLASLTPRPDIPF